MVSASTAVMAVTIQGVGVVIKHSDLYRIEAGDLSPSAHATQRLTEHPYGNLQERLQEWLQRPTVAFMMMKVRDGQ